MTLISRIELQPLLVCPRCNAALDLEITSYTCTNVACLYAHSGSFPIIGDCPAFIDFERSIIDKDVLMSTSAKSVVGRTDKKSFRRRFYNAFGKTNTVAPKNMNTFIKLVKESNEQPVVLEIGGGSIGSASQPLHDDPAIRLISFDVYSSPAVQFIADGHQIPLADGSVDAVVIQAVLEHVLNPWKVASEICRVLKDDGLLYSEVPFMQQVHEGAYDFTRFTLSGHRYLFNRFAALDSGVIGGPATQYLWTINYLTRSIFRSRYVGILMRMGFFWLRYLDRIIPEDYSIDAASATYFMGRKLDHEISPKDMPHFYKGAQ